MELNEILKRLLAGPFLENQAGLGKLIGVDPSQVSRLQNRAIPKWEVHFAVFWKVVGLAVKHKVITENDILRGTHHDGHLDDSPDPPGSVPAGQRKTTKAKNH